VVILDLTDCRSGRLDPIPDGVRNHITWRLQHVAGLRRRHVGASIYDAWTLSLNDVRGALDAQRLANAPLLLRSTTQDSRGIEGRRLDALASTLRPEVPNGYGVLDFLATYVIFPTPGSWELTGPLWRRERDVRDYRRDGRRRAGRAARRSIISMTGRRWNRRPRMPVPMFRLCCRRGSAKRAPYRTFVM
jgi:hypothetical protein